MKSLIAPFLSYLIAERGLAPNTIQAYGADLRLFCASLKGKSPEQREVVAHLSHLKEQGHAVSSIVRALISLRLFFRFLHSEGYLPSDPTALLEGPKMGQLIPEVLTSREVERLLEAPEKGSAEGDRDRAILETLYATGLRASELCQLRLSDVKERTVWVRGKGGKERIVPIGGEAASAIDHYLAHHRTEREDNPPLFLSKRGKALSRNALWELVKRHAKRAGITKTLSPHTLRH